MKQIDKDQLHYRLNKLYGPEDRSLPDIYIPQKMPVKKERFLKVAYQAFKDFFTFKQFGG